MDRHQTSRRHLGGNELHRTWVSKIGSLKSVVVVDGLRPLVEGLQANYRAIVPATRGSCIFVFDRAIRFVDFEFDNTSKFNRVSS